MGWRHGIGAVTLVLLASLSMVPGCGPDATDRSESGSGPVGDAASTAASDQAEAGIDLTGLPGYRESRARVERARELAGSTPPWQWLERMSIPEDAPLERHELARAAALTVVSLPYDGVHTVARSHVTDDRDAWELAINLTDRALEFSWVHRDPWFVVPLIERLGRGGDPQTFEDYWFEEAQMALVTITGNDDAPHYHRARPEERRRAAQEYWVEWWTANGRRFTRPGRETGDRAMHRWMQKREP